MRVGPTSNDWCPSVRRRSDTQTHAVKVGILRTQTSSAAHKPRCAGSHQELEDAETFLQRGLWKNRDPADTLILDF